jgi:predicted nucleic acid-binding Zn ribbon protein
MLESIFSHHMERAGRSIAKLRSQNLAPDQLAVAAWPAAVGERLAAKTNAVMLVRTRLVIEVEDAVWQKQLFQLREQILPKLRAVIGPGIVEELEFRVVPRVPRRPPQMAAAVSADAEADGIRDPIFRTLYKQARKKAIS